MNKTPQNEYSLPKDSYVAFDAINLRNLILKRLDEQGIYTDHNYLGSNLASIIDIISYAYNTLIFYLHKTSNESMFTEAQLTENINRIVKLLDYKPIGYQTSTLVFRASADGLPRGFYTIPRYTSVFIGETQFSFGEDLTFAVTQETSNTVIPELDNKKMLHQGSFREFPVYVAAGNESEVLVLNTGSLLIDHSNIHVYVYEDDKETWFQYQETPTLHSENAQAKVFEKRLNSAGNYEITFGNNINGKKLNAGDRVVIYYLVGSGADGVVGPNVLGNKAVFSVLFDTTIYQEIKSDTNTEGLNYLAANQFVKLKFGNDAGSTMPVQAEDASSIRKNAPNIYKTQNRLVTKNDYESYIMTNFKNVVSDVKVFDNWDYTTKYLKYFHNISVKPQAFGQMLLNQIQFADNCNFNNVYVCAVPRTSKSSSLKYLLPSQKEIIKNSVDSLRTITTEVTFLEPIYKAVGFGVDAEDTIGTNQADISRLEIIKRSDSNKSDNALAQEVVSVFEDFFDIEKVKLGNPFDYVGLVSKVLSIQGIESVRTRRTDSGKVCEGLCFLMWNPNYPDLDFEVVSSSRTMNPFELIYFYDSANISSKIIVTKN